jgi:hypothetical protein
MVVASAVILTMADPITIITTLRGLAEKLIVSVKDRQAAAEARNILLLIGQLQSEFFTLQTQILDLKAENLKLKQGSPVSHPSQSKQTKDNPDVTEDLDDVSVKMLVLLANAPNGIKKEQLFSHFGLSNGKGELLFQRMSQKKFVEMWTMNMLTGATWAATSVGREYLDKLGLL